MKALPLSFFILATVVILTAALPEDKAKDQQSLIDSNQENEKSLQRRRPPIKVPGPKLKNTEETPENNSSPLANDDKGKKKGKKDVNLKNDNKNDDLSSLDDDKRGERGKKGKKDANLRKDNKKYDLSSLDDDKRGERGKGKGKGKDKDLVKREEETQEERDVEKPKI